MTVFYRMVSNTEKENATPFEEMSPPELSNCIQKFYLSSRKRDGSFYNKKSLNFLVACCFSPLRPGKYCNRCWNNNEIKSIVCGVCYVTGLV